MPPREDRNQDGAPCQQNFETRGEGGRCIIRPLRLLATTPTARREAMAQPSQLNALTCCREMSYSPNSGLADATGGSVKPPSENPLLVPAQPAYNPLPDNEGEACWPRSISVNHHFVLAVAIFGLGLAGCGETRPSLTHPGTIQQQQARANRFDPYPEPDTGPSPATMAGTRPRDYQNPAAEPMRATWDYWNPPCPTSGTAAYPTAPYPPAGQVNPSSAAPPRTGPYSTPAYTGAAPTSPSYTPASPGARYSPAAYSGSSQAIPDTATQPAIPYSGAAPAVPAGR
jgi:hypothetical protein